MTEGYTYSQLIPLVKECLDEGQSVLLLGHPGIGKTTLSRQMAEKEFKLPYIDLRVAQRDPAELGGMGYPDKDTGTVRWLKPSWFPEVASLINLDEINSGVTKLHQSCCYQIMLDHGIGSFKFPPGTKIMGAGNLEEDNAIVTPLSTALLNRCASFLMRVDTREWLQYAENRGLPADYMAYIAWGREKALYNNTGEAAFPTPRSNEAAARLTARLTQGDTNDTKRKRLVASRIGEAQANQYMTFIKVYRNIKIKDIVDKGLLPPNLTSSEESFLYALIYSLASYVAPIEPAKLAGTRAKNILTLLQKLADKPEYQSTFLRMLVDMLGKKKGFFDVLRTVEGFSQIATRISNILSPAN